jgi:flagellar biosynthesis/type III secretory pathway chaperone
VNYASEIMRILNRELVLCSELLYVTRAQRGVIMSGDVAGLAELVARAEQTLGKIRDAEKGLLDLAERYSGKAGAERESPDKALSDIIASLSEEETAELKTLRDSIADILVDIDSANAINAMLLRDSIQYIENTVKLIAEADGANSVYSRLGRLDEKAAASTVNETA